MSVLCLGMAIVCFIVGYYLGRWTMQAWISQELDRIREIVKKAKS